MTRFPSFALLALAASLTACGPDLSPAEHYARATTAVEAGDADTARRHFRAAARDGHLRASSALALAYRSGSFHQPQAEGRGPESGARLLPTRQSDWEARRWSGHFFRLLRQPTSDPALRRMQARDLFAGRPDGSEPFDVYLGSARGAPDARPAQRDSATAILRQLVAEGDAEAARQLAWASTTDAERERHLATAVELGSPSACFWQAYGMSGDTAEQIAASLDAMDACAAMPGWNPPPQRADVRAQMLETLRAQASQDNAEARALLDRLVALGAFPDA